MEDKNIKKTKGSAYTQPNYIKPKSKWTKKTTIWVIVIAVIVLGILAIIGAENGWFKTADMINGKIEVEDYSTIELDESSVQVSESTIDNYLNSIVSAETTYETITEGTVEDGDTINLDYSGVLDGEEEPFDGGTATGTSLVLGSGSMIDGFEDQIIGHEIGETFDIQVTFPEDYSTEDLAGKDATFTITINSKTVADVPELTDELVKHYTEENFDETYETIEDLREYYRDRLYNSYLESSIMSAMEARSNVVYYNEKDLADMTAYSANTLAYYASSYGWDSEMLASLYGYDSAAAYAESEAKETLKQTMIIDKVAEEQNITFTQEEVDEVLTRYMENEGYTGTLDEFREASGDAFLFLVTETEVKMPKVLDYLKGNVVLVESPEEETEEAGAEDVSEAVEDAAEDVAEDVSKAVEDAAEDVAENVSEAVEDAAEDVSEAVDEAAEAVEDAVEEVSEAADTAAEAIEDAAEDASEAINDTVEDAAEAISDAPDAAKDAVEELTSKAN